MIRTILSFGFLSFAVIFLVPFGVLAMIFHFLGLKKSMAVVVYQLARLWAFSIIKISGSTITVAGRENIPKKGGVCFISNHNGYFDIVMLLAYCGRPFGFVAKKELLLIPFLNVWIFMLGGLFIDRRSVKKAIKTINNGALRIKSGGGMVIFPEGHRSKEKILQPFHSGSLKLATLAEAPIVPVAIDGSYKVYEKAGRVQSASVKITFCKVIETANLPPENRKHILCDRIYTVIKEQLKDALTENSS